MCTWWYHCFMPRRLHIQDLCVFETSHVTINPAHPAFMKIEIRPKIFISMCNYTPVMKMEVIGCLVPELRSEKHRRRRTQLFEKMTLLHISVYHRVT